MMQTNPVAISWLAQLSGGGCLDPDVLDPAAPHGRPPPPPVPPPPPPVPRSVCAAAKPATDLLGGAVVARSANVSQAACCPLPGIMRHLGESSKSGKETKLPCSKKEVRTWKHPMLRTPSQDGVWRHGWEQCFPGPWATIAQLEQY